MKPVCIDAHIDGDFSATFERVVRDVCEEIGTPRALAVWLLFSNGEHNQLLALEMCHSSYTSLSAFSDDYLVTSFLKKYPGLKTGLDLKAEAMRKFYEAEAKCERTNRELDQRLQANARANQILWAAREKCHRWLPSLSKALPLIFQKVKWGNGVTSAAKGSSLSAYRKFQVNLEASADLIAAGVHNFVNSIPAWSTYHTSGNPDSPASVTRFAFKSVPGNVVTTVPKNAKTDRTIAVEPHVNAFLQRGIGVFLRDVLKDHGCDLRSQERNQRLAQQGSLDGSLATIDLSAASDSISDELVRYLLPTEWYDLLTACRSKFYRSGSEWRAYHKHSSMGNGYTFELETLMFLTISLSVCQHLELPRNNVSVYGDDIIVPTDAYDVLVEVLEIAGFSTNIEKTFRDGPFRESCGKDYFNGVNVRPFFAREKLTSIPALYRLANNLRRYGAMRCADMGIDARFKRAWKRLFFACSPRFRHRIPDGVGDDGFIGSFDECRPSIDVRKDRHCQRILFRTTGIGFRSRKGLKNSRCLSVASALYEMDRKEWFPSDQLTGGTLDIIDNRFVIELLSGLTDQLSAPLDRTKFDYKGDGHWYERTIRFTEWSAVGGWV